MNFFSLARAKVFGIDNVKSAVEDAREKK